jgi:hypothetical protein
VQITHVVHEDYELVPNDWAVSAPRIVSGVGMIAGDEARAVWETKIGAVEQRNGDACAFSPGIDTCTGVAMLFERRATLVHLSPIVVNDPQMLSQILEHMRDRGGGKLKKVALLHWLRGKSLARIHDANKNILDVIKDFNGFKEKNVFSIESKGLKPALVAVNCTGEIGTFDQETRDRQLRSPGA